MKINFGNLISNIAIYFSIFMVGLTSIILSVLLVLFSFNPNYRLPLTEKYVLFAIISGIPSIIVFVGMILKKSWAYLFSILLFIYLFIIMLVAEISFYKLRSSGFENVNSNSGLKLPLVILMLLILAFTFIPKIRQYFNFVSIKKLIGNFKNAISFSILLFSISFIISSDVFIINKFSYNQRFLKPQPHKENKPEFKKWKFYIKGEISDENIKKLIKTVNNCPNIDKRIYSIYVHESDSVSVMTGEMKDVLWGSGNSLEIILRDNEWRIVRICSWMS
jgi:hypothetical protein